MVDRLVPEAPDFPDDKTATKQIKAIDGQRQPHHVEKGDTHLFRPLTV